MRISKIITKIQLDDSMKINDILLSYKLKKNNSNVKLYQITFTNSKLSFVLNYKHMSLQPNFILLIKVIMRCKLICIYFPVKFYSG